MFNELTRLTNVTVDENARKITCRNYTNAMALTVTQALRLRHRQYCFDVCGNTISWRDKNPHDEAIYATYEAIDAALYFINAHLTSRQSDDGMYLPLKNFTHDESSLICDEIQDVVQTAMKINDTHGHLEFINSDEGNCDYIVIIAE